MPNYLNNAELYQEMVHWKEQGPETKMPDSIANAIMQICRNLARSGRFSGYTWKDDMIQEAILDCVKGARSFNPEKTNNPFAYFTQIAYNAFRRYLNIEHARLAAIESYKQEMDTPYEIDGDEDCYDSITAEAKSTDTAYQKQYTVKKKKKVRTYVMNIDELCFGGD